MDDRVLLDEQTGLEQPPLLEEVVDNIPGEIHQLVDRRLHGWSRHTSMVLRGCHILREARGVSGLAETSKQDATSPVENLAASGPSQSGALAAASNFLMPVPGIITPSPEDGVGLPRCGPKLKQVVIDRALGELPCVTFIPALGTDAQPVGTRRNVYGPCVLASPGTQGHFVSLRKRDGYLDDVLPLPVIASRRSVQKHHPNRRPARPASKVDVYPLGKGGTHQPVDLALV